MSLNTSEARVPLITSFLRYNISAGTASSGDFLMLIFCTELLGIYYVVSTFIGSVTGATIAFILGRNWTFLNKEGRVSSQGGKFLIIMAGSVLFNTSGVYLFTEYIGIGHYTISKLIVAILVGITWNFPMQRNFVFK